MLSLASFAHQLFLTKHLKKAWILSTVVALPSLILLTKIKVKPSLGRVPFFMLLPFQQALFRAEWSQLGFEGMNVCDDGFAAMLMDRNIRNKVEVLLMVWPAEVI